MTLLYSLFRVKLLLPLWWLSSLGTYAQLPNPADLNAYSYPGAQWETVADPAAQQWDVDQLHSLKQFIIDSAHTTGMMIVHHRKVVFTYGDVAELSYIASCRKSILAMLYGPFVQSGQVNLDKTLQQLSMNDLGGLLPIEKQATIRHLLTARSGVYHSASNEGDQSDQAPNRGSIKPGSFFLYNNWG